MEEKGVKGRYVSIERIVELEDGSTEWRMATSSTPGGSLPSWLAETSMAGKISEVRCSSYLCFLSHEANYYLLIGRPSFHEVAS